VSRIQAEQRSAGVFGARNLGRAVIELLVSDDWAVTGVARSATHELQLTPLAENWTP
jgi:hypothetical protein